MVLHLVIKKQFFDAILDGSKKTETREIRPKNANRYIEYLLDEEGIEYVSSKKNINY